MNAGTTWRRLSDWKRTVQLVVLDDVGDELARAHRLVRPEEHLRERFPRLAALLATTRLAQVDRRLAAKLREAGIATYEVGYHRVSDGLWFALESRDGRAALAGAVSLAIALVARAWTPLLAVVAAPVVALCLVVILLHEAALRQDRRHGEADE